MGFFETNSKKKIDVYNLVDLKNRTDEIVIKALEDREDFKSYHRTEDLSLLLGSISLVVAGIVSFEENYRKKTLSLQYLGWCCSIFMLLQLVDYLVRKIWISKSIFFGYNDKAKKAIVFESESRDTKCIYFCNVFISPELPRNPNLITWLKWRAEGYKSFEKLTTMKEYNLWYTESGEVDESLIGNWIHALFQERKLLNKPHDK